MKLYEHQKNALNETKEQNKVAYYHDMGLGKTFTGSEKLMQLNEKINLIVCQKSKINDWYDHFMKYYKSKILIFDLTDETHMNMFMHDAINDKWTEIVGIINYDLIWRRPELMKLKNFTLLLDESSLIQNPTSKRSKFIIKMEPKNVILLSGTPTGGKYEKLITQILLLGWNIKEDVFWNQYVDWEWNETDDGFWQKKIMGYKNVERLNRKLRQHGCNFLKTEEVINLPDQIDQKIKIDNISQYDEFHKESYYEINGEEIIGDNILTKLLRERQLCGIYNEEKFSALKDLIMSTDDRLIVFYNFISEAERIKQICNELHKPVDEINGDKKDLTNYEKFDNAVIIIQYQAGSMGLNLQKANKIIYFTPPLSSELFEQSKKRIHRIGQNKTCFYYYLICKKSIEEHIYRTLNMRKDYTQKLFEEE